MSEIIHADAFDALPTLDTESVHGAVTDPPYGLAFMGRDWDSFEPREYQEWCQGWGEAVKRVLKPGGHLLAFSGNRTHHRLFAGIEDAGFEIRDTVTWHYGGGFPKALDVSKAIDKAEGAEREVLSTEYKSGGDRVTMNVTGNNGRVSEGASLEGEVKNTAPATDAAKEWEGWKTSLKPATEFIVLARKPFEGTVAENVKAHGTGALNIDGNRIDHDEVLRYGAGKREHYEGGHDDGGHSDSPHSGRYPPNVIFGEEIAQSLDREVGDSGGGTFRQNKDVDGDGSGVHDGYQRPNASMFTDDEPDGIRQYGDTGGPSRYFYTSKATRAERTLNGKIDNAHPTVKPVDLMEWLVRLISAEGQTVLDPFAGTGTTCRAAKNLGRDFIGIEKQEKWADVARVRCGLTPENPEHVRGDDNQAGIESFTD